jgi:hypothetical protein
MIHFHQKIMPQWVKINPLGREIGQFLHKMTHLRPILPGDSMFFDQHLWSQ